jgi:hypothetical protein
MTGMLALDISIFEYTQWRLTESLVIVKRSSVLMLTRKGVVGHGRLSGWLHELAASHQQCSTIKPTHTVINHYPKKEDTG